MSDQHNNEHFDEKNMNYEQEEGENSQGEEEDQKKCIVCEEIPDSIICLACNHDIDIPCAAKVILSTQDLNDIDISQIVCPLCGEVTQLSKEVQVAIIEFLQNEELEFDAEEGQEEELEVEEEMEDGKEEDNMGYEDQEQEYIQESDDNRRNNLSNHLYPQGNQQSQLQKEEVDEGEEEQSVSASRTQNSQMNQTNTASELSFHFACLTHPSEEYAYYSPTSKQLYCAQCILSDPNIRNLNDLRSIRRSLPLIMQHFQDLLNNVEVSRSLLENRRKDTEIKLDDVKAKMNSVKYFVEMRYDELVEMINEVKTGVLDSLEEKFEGMLDELKGIGERFDNKIEYFDAVLGQVRDIQTDSDNSDEDLLGFFFANQNRIETIIKEEAGEEQLNRILEQCSVIESNIEKEMKKEMTLSVKKTCNCLTESFKEFLHRKEISLSTPQKIAPISSTPHGKLNNSLYFSEAKSQEKYRYNHNPIFNKEILRKKNYFNYNTRMSNNTDNSLSFKTDTKPRMFKSKGKFADPIDEIEKKLEMFDLKNMRRPQTSYSRGTGDVSTMIGVEEFKETRVADVQSLRQFRQKMRAKLLGDSINRRNRSYFMGS